jgi:hypothetical protein
VQGRDKTIASQDARAEKAAAHSWQLASCLETSDGGFELVACELGALDHRLGIPGGGPIRRRSSSPAVGIRVGSSTSCARARSSMLP